MQDITSIKNVLIPSKFLQNVNATKLNLYNYISSVLTQLGITAVAPPTYKVYRIIARFSGSSLGIITTLENTLGVTPNLTRTGTGSMRISTSAFSDTNKMFITVTGSNNGEFASYIATVSTQQFNIEGYVQDNTTKDMVLSDNAFYAVFIEIKINN
jgi:hypothetical protein